MIVLRTRQWCEKRGWIAFTVTPTIRNVYLYAVCFATLLMMVIGFIQAADGLFGVIYPAPVETPYYDFKQPSDGMTLEQWQEQNRINQEAQAKRDHYYQVRRIVENLIMFGVALPIYLYHWRKIEKGDKTLPLGDNDNN